ncbi:MAG: nitronate monooxygenase [Lautropia sp.]|nr:nitronate monooxygenase [Lautropia sp.]
MPPAATEFCQRLGIRHPIIQAPMAGVATPALAAAVSRAGGLGSLGLGASSATQARAMVKATWSEDQLPKTLPLNLNVFCHQPPIPDPTADAAWLNRLAPLFGQFSATAPSELKEIYPSFLRDGDMQALLLEMRPTVVSFHFGLPDADYLNALKTAGIFLMASATNLSEAQAIEAAGLDAIIAQGIEAGGHRGMFNPAAADERLPAHVLLSQLRAQTKLPIVAAGGIMNGQGIRSALDLGAAAVQMGTAFILCPESSASPAYRVQLGSERARHTRLTAALSGRPARGLLNDFIQQIETSDGAPPAAYPRAYDAFKQLSTAATRAGSDEYNAHWAGQGAPLARALPAAELMTLLVQEAGLISS